MKTITAKIARLYRQVRGLFPSRLPTGAGGFDAWVADIRRTYDLPTEDDDSIRFSFATMIMHLGPTDANKPKYYFVLALRSAAAKQVAGSEFQAIKTRQAQLQAERQRQAQAEATALSAVADAQAK